MDFLSGNRVLPGIFRAWMRNLPRKAGLRMMTSVESMLLQMEQRGRRWMERPWLARGVRGGALVLGGGALAALSAPGGLQPGCLGLVIHFRGWQCCAAAVGSAGGYLLLWGRAGVPGVLWVLGAVVLAMAVPRTLPRLWLGGLTAAMALGICLAFGLEHPEVSAGVAAVSCALGCCSGAVPAALALGAGAMGLSCRSPTLGIVAGGLGAAALPGAMALSVALGAGLGAGWPGLPLGVLLGRYFLPLLPRHPLCRWFALTAGGLMTMLLTGDTRWDWLALASLGSLGGSVFPEKRPRRGRVGAAQVQLEGMARLFTRLQRQLLDWVCPGPDVGALLLTLRRSTCDVCPRRTGCLEQQGMNASILEKDVPFPCPRGETAAEVARARDSLRRMQGLRARQEECRMALAQQYGFLADALRQLADRLPGHSRRPWRYRVQVSARSKSRQRRDGDRVAAFAGPEGRFYVLLCDGMGTGPEAAAESRETVGLVMQMLQSGLTPGAVLGSINSQLALTQRGGAVTLDLAELHPDTGRVWLYKWGAQPSVLLRRCRSHSVGSPGPPPGLGVTRGRESVSRVRLLPGDSLLLLSDGVSQSQAPTWAKLPATTPPGTLAAQILTPPTPDDATAIVIRLIPK